MNLVINYKFSVCRTKKNISMNIKKNIFLSVLFIFNMVINAQEPPSKTKVEKTTESINQKVNDLSTKATNQAQQITGTAQNVIGNAKAIIKIFEPILRFRLKKKTDEGISNQSINDVTGSNQAVNSNQTINIDTTTNTINTTEQTTTYVQEDPSAIVTQNDIMQGIPIVAESPAYNTDGTANLGSQNHKQFGCYIDIQQGAILDDIDAAGLSKSVDLIFTATSSFNEQVPMYAFLSPAYVKNDPFAYNFFKGVKYKDRNIPPATWEEVNESEVAMTSLTAAQFEKIKDNNQLMAVVKQIKGFGQKVESRTKLDGKVIAVKTEMGDRTAYSLLYIMNHYGTTGENGYLKVKIKVTGFDANGDGIPDGNLYQQ